jgi:hypothetical protein
MPAIRSTVNRSIWKTVVNRPKTRASAQAVPVIRQLVEIPECESPFHGKSRNRFDVPPRRRRADGLGQAGSAHRWMLIG